jgi:hypothetical protein
MPKLILPPDVVAAEPWLQALVMPTDLSVDDVRERARRATKGEIIRRYQAASDDHLRVRSQTGAIRRTEYEAQRVVLEHDGTIALRPIGGEQ